jgi:hypothetical protein
MARPTIEYMNGRRAAKPAIGGKVYLRRGEYAPEEKDPRLEKFRTACLRMARAVNYRPEAPTDGIGNIELSAAELRDLRLLHSEAWQYATRFFIEDDECHFFIGCSDFATSGAFCFVIEAARQLATGTAGRATALGLLRLAIGELHRVGTKERPCAPTEPR